MPIEEVHEAGLSYHLIAFDDEGRERRDDPAGSATSTPWSTAGGSPARSSRPSRPSTSPSGATIRLAPGRAPRSTLFPGNYPDIALGAFGLRGLGHVELTHAVWQAAVATAGT
jgi:hypothetical protein